MPPDPVGRTAQDALSTADVDVLALLAAEAARFSAPPPDQLRSRILATARVEPFTFISSESGIWIECPGGGAAKELFHDSGDRASTRLLRVDAVQPLPPSSIEGSRGILVVRGGLRLGETVLGVGEFLSEGSEHRRWLATSDSLLLEYTNARVDLTESKAATAAGYSAFPGGRMRTLVGGHGDPQEVYVLEMAPRSALGEHEHGGVEELFVLGGSCHIEGRAMAVGDYHRAAAGTHHQPTATDDGCVLVVSVRDLPRLAA